MNSSKSGVVSAILCWLMILASPSLWAAMVEAKLPNGTMVAAEFRGGKASMPTVLLIHGFMQTRNFQTLSRLTDGLFGAGFSTLAPTLSLGISQRARSLPCEAIHHHTLEQDVAEIDFWMQWLARHKPGPVVIVGHSFGSFLALVYAADKPSPKLQQLIALSLVDAERQTDPLINTAMLNEAKQRIAKGDTQLMSGTFNHCKKFVSTPQSFYSYARWNRQDILRLLRQSKVPMEVIMGGNDDRMGGDWPDMLRAYGNRVQVIAGANHFFDAEYEFDVLDATIALSKTAGKKK